MIDRKKIDERAEAVFQESLGLPRIGPEELTDDEKQYGHSQYGNNLFLVFLEMKMKKTDAEASKGYINSHLNKAEQLGARWTAFMEGNLSLIHEIEHVLTEQQISSKIMDVAFDYAVRLKDFSAGDAFDRRFHPEIGVASVQVPVWRKLNALLQRAAEAMRAAGIDPALFY